MGFGDSRARVRGRASTPRSERIVVVDTDPQLVHLLRAHVSPATVVVATPDDDLHALLDPQPALVLVDLASPRLLEVGLYTDVLPVVGVGRPTEADTPVEGLRAVFARPYDPTAVLWTVEQLLHPPTPRREILEWWRRGTPWVLPMLELAALGVALPELMGGGARLALAYVVGVVATLAPLPRKLGFVAATAAAATMLAIEGDPSSSVVLYALAVAARAGVEGGVRAGPSAGGILALAALPGLVAASRGLVAMTMVMATMLVYPAIALASAQTVRLRRRSGRAAADAGALQQALRRLQEQVEESPSGLALRATGQHIAVKAARDLRANVVIVLTGATVLRMLAHVGARDVDLHVHPEDPALTLLERQWVPGKDLPGTFGALAASGRWRAVPLVHDRHRIGLLLVGLERAHRVMTAGRVRHVSRMASLDLANALLLQRLERLGTDQARMQVAHLLDAKLTTPLAHLRFELAYLQREVAQGPPDLVIGVARAADVARRVMVDTAATLAELASVRTRGGLTAALHEFGRELTDATGPPVEVHGDLGPRVDPLVEQELFGITTALVAGALRWAGPGGVGVELGRRGNELRVVVRGPTGAWSDDQMEGNIDLDELRARADQLGATLLAHEDAVGTYEMALVWAGTGAPLGVRP